VRRTDEGDKIIETQKRLLRDISNKSDISNVGHTGNRNELRKGNKLGTGKILDTGPILETHDNEGWHLLPLRRATLAFTILSPAKAIGYATSS